MGCGCRKGRAWAADVPSSDGAVCCRRAGSKKPFAVLCDEGLLVEMKSAGSVGELNR